ncbi:hypothetical protein VN97_g4230 [Penicillium thymicola]|uniref:Uncharacterized protein n=1 Tax=Penicillium thymicola TaxID=293382 RepID=A0AAI9XAC7_PENTH|nr:hypothetical protein VN97_g4230 [Penicillium thymicola]
MEKPLVQTSTPYEYTASLRCVAPRPRPLTVHKRPIYLRKKPRHFLTWHFGSIPGWLEKDINKLPFYPRAVFDRQHNHPPEADSYRNQTVGCSQWV